MLDNPNGGGTGSNPPDQPGELPRKGPVDLSTSKVISDTFFAAAAKVAVQILKPVRSVIFGRLLGPHLYGILNIPVPYITIFTLTSSIGFNDAITKLIPQYLQKGQPDRARMIYRATAFLTGSLSVMWYLLLFIFSRAIVDNVAHQPDALGTFRLYTLMIPFLTLNTFFAVAFLVLQRGKLRAKITIFYGALNVLLPIAAVLFKRNVTLVAGGFVAAEIVGAVVFAMNFRRSVAPSLGRQIGSLIQGIREVFTLGISFFFAQLGWNLIQSVDRIMVKVYLPAAQLGFYSMSTLFVTTLGMISSTLGIALVPSLSASQTAGDTATFKKQIRNTSRAGFLALVPIVTSVYVLAPDLIMFLVPRFEPSINVIRILIFIGIFDLSCRISKAALVAHSRGRLLSGAYLAAAAWNIGFNAVLIPRMGIEGAAVASLTSFILLAAVLAGMMKRVSGATFRFAHLLHPAALSSVYILAGLAMPAGGHLTRILVVTIPGTALYILLTVLTRLVTLDDLATARRALAPRGHIPHVRFALRLISMAEAISRRVGH